MRVRNFNIEDFKELYKEVKTDLILKAKEKALQKLKEYDIIKEEKTVLKQVGNITNLTYLITVKRNIGG